MEQLVLHLTGKLLRQVAELRGVVNVVVQHVLQQRHRLLAADRLAVAVGVVMGVVVGMAVGVVPVVKMVHTVASRLIDINLTKYTIAQFCQVCKG